MFLSFLLNNPFFLYSLLEIHFTINVYNLFNRAPTHYVLDDLSISYTTIVIPTNCISFNNPKLISHILITY